MSEPVFQYELKEPPTAAEVAELLVFVKDCAEGHTAGMILRRLMFERDKLEQQLADAVEERERFAGVLERIDGGDNPCTDESKLRQWAYETITLGRNAENLSP